MAAVITYISSAGLPGGVLRGEAGSGTPPKACEAAAALPPQIRTTSGKLADAVARGMAHSATFRRLVERIGALHGVVYLLPRPFIEPSTGRVIDGSLQHHVTEAGPYRFLFASVLPGSGARTVGIIAHELQHAIEILESGAIAERDIDELFERIGARLSAWTMETSAAVHVQYSVAKELFVSDNNPGKPLSSC